MGPSEESCIRIEIPKILDYWLSSSSNWKTHPKESKFIVSKSSKDLSNQDSKLPNIWNVSNHEDNQEKRHPTLESHVSLLPLPSFATIWNFQIWKVSSQIGARIICNQANSLHLKVISRCGAQEKSFQAPNKDQIRSPTSQRTKIIQSFKFLSNSRVQAKDYKKKKRKQSCKRWKIRNKAKMGERPIHISIPPWTSHIISLSLLPISSFYLPRFLLQ